MPEILIIFILCAGIIVIGIILCIIIKVSHMSDDEQKRTMNDSWSSFAPTRSIKKDIEFKGLYNKRHTGKVQISSVSGIFGFNLHCDVYFVCLLRYLFTMREVSQADEREKRYVGKSGICCSAAPLWPICIRL